MEPYQGSTDRGEGGCESDINCLGSVNLRKYTTVPISVRNFPGPERGVFCIVTVNLISRNALVGFSLLHARDYYYRKGTVCYVFMFYSKYCSGDL